MGGQSEPFRDEPLTRIQAHGAKRLSESWPVTPHFYLQSECDATGLLAFKSLLQESFPTGRVSHTAIMVALVARVLTRHPRLNSQYRGEVVRLFSSVNVAVAMATEQGLLVPVIRDAHRRDCGEIAEALKRLQARARNGRLEATDISGATFSITNLGMYGIDRFWPVINPPQAAILAVGRIREVPLADSGRVTVRSTTSLTLAVDHRAADGAAAALFFNDLVAALGDPAPCLGPLGSPELPGATPMA